MAKYDFYKYTDELKKLIVDNPDLPIVVLVGEEVNIQGWGYMFAPTISCSVEEILDCDDITDYNDEVITDRDRLEEILADRFFEENTELPEEVIDSLVREKLKELEPNWKKVIAIYADN